MRGLGGNRAGQVQLRTQFAAPLPEAALTRFLDVGMKVSAPAAAARFDTWSAGDPAGNDPTAFGGPALIAGGHADGFVTPDLLTAVFAPRFPQAVVRYVPNAGHWPHVEQPAASAELLTTFLDTIDRSRVAKRRGEP
jgi:pimeloyl-ACP methyl ester carboxylesterase